MKLYLSFDTALKKHNISASDLKRLVDSGDVQTIRIENDSQSFNAYYNDDIASHIADNEIKQEDFKHLSENFLSMNQAHKKYGVSLSTLHNWITQKKLKYKPYKNRKLINEARLAFMLAIAEAKNIRPGKKIF